MDAQRRQLVMQGLGQSLDSELGRAVDAEARSRLVAAQLRDVDDMAAAARAHRRQHGARHVQQAEDGARLGRDAVAGPLRIAAPRSIMLPVLWPVLEDFCARHPEVEPDVQLDDRIGDWVQERVDVGFRAGSPPSDGVVARHLLPLQLIVCAAPAYIARHGAPQSIDELARHRCSGFRHPGTGKAMPWEFAVDGEIVARDIASVVTTNDVELEANAVVAGQCIGQLVGVTAAPLIRAGRLVPLLTAHVAEHLGLYLYYGSRVAQPARVRAFIDLAVERVAGRRADWVLGAQELAAAARRRARR
jgi:DNA-binding transcriptional LysR family regulator